MILIYVLDIGLTWPKDQIWAPILAKPNTGHGPGRRDNQPSDLRAPKDRPWNVGYSRPELTNPYIIGPTMGIQSGDQLSPRYILYIGAVCGDILTKPMMVNQDEEGVAYSDHSSDERHQDQQQVDLDLNATANGSTESADRNVDTGGTQNSQPKSGGDNFGGQRSTSAFDRLGPGNPDPKPFGGIGTDETQIIQELRHRMQAMELEVKGLRKENIEL
ncbi:hypothetical protein PIB30_011283 [Stylosanthes scabra]|uniref:Uncharacterized protein n=1 Tax=Stylosanthes scabra TaxID=79078 RepID=A0ABU6V8Z2_9FABA|nr:hypothetical protein [Stylosanthes scabra]